jgi:hypothetical protein
MKFQAACAGLSTPQAFNTVQSWALRLGMSIYTMMHTNASLRPPMPKSSKNQSTTITLIPPKGATLPPPGPRQKKLERKPDCVLDTPPCLKRSGSAMLPLRNIHTPDWCDTSTDDLEVIDLGPFDTVAASRRWPSKSAQKAVNCLRERAKCGSGIRRCVSTKRKAQGSRRRSMT